MMYVTSLRIQYSDDGRIWYDIAPSTRYSAKDQILKNVTLKNTTMTNTTLKNAASASDDESSQFAFKGLSKWNETKDIWFEGPFYRYPFVIRSSQLRIYPLTWVGWPCMRLDAFWVSN